MSKNQSGGKKVGSKLWTDALEESLHRYKIFGKWDTNLRRKKLHSQVHPELKASNGQYIFGQDMTAAQN